MSIESSRKDFNEKLLELNNASSNRSLFLDRERYERTLQEVKEAQLLRKRNQPLTSKHYRRLRRYDILKVDDQEKLIENIGGVKTSADEDNIRCYCKLEELYDVLEETHLSTGHKKTRIMEAELKKKYCNVTRQVIELYIAHCVQCQLKKLQPKRKLVICSGTETKPLKREFPKQNPILTEYMDVRGLVEIIDMQVVADREYCYILNYQDKLTKFTILRPMKSRAAEAVAEQLVDIYCLFGAPFILQCSDNDRQFTSLIVEKLLKLWPKLKLVHGKQNELCSDDFKFDVREVLITWMTANKTLKWSEALGFVQSEINRTQHPGIDMSPHAAMFGMSPRIGLADAQHFTEEALASIETEEELEELCQAQIRKERVKKLKLETAETGEEEANDTDSISFYINNESFSNSLMLTPNADEDKISVNLETKDLDMSPLLENHKINVITCDLLPGALDIGTSVMIRQPDKDVTTANEHLVPNMALAVVVGVNAEGLYELATKQGLLDRLYQRHEITMADNEFIDAAQGLLSSSLSLLAEHDWN